MNRRRVPSSSSGMLPLLALQVANEFYRIGRKPPVTAGLIAANTVIYLRPSFLESIIPHIDDVWFNPYLIFKYRDLKRLLLSSFYHVNEPHLVYNMISLLWKGIQLESLYGSVEFAFMVGTLVAMSQGITLLLAKSLLVFFDYEKAYFSEYSVGFSGVLFALKVVLNSQSRSDDYTIVHGMLLPARYAAWAELILIQMFVPGVSFLGHLGGILAGIIYIYLKGNNTRSGLDPLGNIIRGGTAVITWPLRVLRRLLPRRMGRVSGGTGTRWASPGTWRCETCTYDNSGWMTICEMCGTSRGVNNSFSQHSLHQPRVLSLEELRLRRIEILGR